MASLSDVDLESAVRKFLERSSVVNREDTSADTSEETQAILESLAVSFLLYPQCALSFVLLAKNVVQKLLATDIVVVDFLLKAVDDVDNPDEIVTDTSDLIEAQTALVEVDRLGRLGTEIKAYSRYTGAIDRFLNRRLAKSLKRRRRNEFERTGTEAKQDIFGVMAAFGPAHAKMASHLSLLFNSVTNFNSVDLTRVVSTKTLTRVRSSLLRVLQGVQTRTVSHTAVAIELLSGAAALKSISSTRKLSDPAVETGKFPVGRTLKLSSEVVSAKASSLQGPFDLSSLATPWTFSLITDIDNHGGTASYTATLPVTGASGRVWLKSASFAQSYTVPVGGNILYVQFDGIAPPVGKAAMVRAVPLPTGVVTLTAVLAALNHGTTGLLYGTAVEMAAGTGRIVIYGTAPVTKISVLSSVPGTFDGISFAYIPATISAHSILGFENNQESSALGTFTAPELADLLSAQIPAAIFEEIEDSGILDVRSRFSYPTSFLTFSGNAATALGFATLYEVNPSYVELVENGLAVDPLTVGVYEGSLVTAVDVDPTRGRNLSTTIARIEGTKLYFSGLLPRCSETTVRSVAPIVFAVQKIINVINPFVGTFDSDAKDLQRDLNPLLSRPTLAQMNDAKKTLQRIRDRLSSLLATLKEIVVSEDRIEFLPVFRKMVASLQERSVDRGLELLQRGQFLEFFALTPAGAAKSNRFLTAVEQVGRNDLSTPTAVTDIKEYSPSTQAFDDSSLSGEDTLDDSDVS